MPLDGAVPHLAAEDRYARDVAIANAAAALTAAEHTLKTTVDRVRAGGGTDSDITAARDALDAAYRADAAARQPVNFPVNYGYSKNGTHLVCHTVTSWHTLRPGNASIKSDKRNFFNLTGQPLDADGNPDPSGCGRTVCFEWARRRNPAIIPAMRLVFGRRSFLRLCSADGPLQDPRAAGPSDADAPWDPLSLEPPGEDADGYIRSCCGGAQGREKVQGSWRRRRVVVR